MGPRTIKTKNQLIEEMTLCEQTQGLTVLEHGESVHRYFLDLHSHVMTGKPLRYSWKLPEWAHSDALWFRLAPMPLMQEYQVYHDCGKPLCREVGEDGKVRFPGHAQTSHDAWLEVGGSEQAATLMLMDMDVHMLKDEGIADFVKREQAATLLITGLCELHSNAVMFGGIESTSFKIKWKALNKRGKKIANLLAS